MVMKSKEISENMGAVAYKCYHCGGILGVTTDYVLFMGAGKFRKHITFDCGYCEKTTFWKPKGEKIHNSK
jgi:hypothetical protein